MSARPKSSSPRPSANPASRIPHPSSFLAPLSPQLLFQQFEALADTPDAVAKLRALVRDLAIRGSLVPQDEQDEPFSHDQAENNGEEDENPYNLPQGWRWLKLSNLAVLLRGVSYRKNEASGAPQPGYVPVLRANNIGNGLNFEDLVYVPKANISPEQLIKRHDVLIAMSSGSKNLVGKAAQARADYPGAFGAFCGLLRLKVNLCPEYFGLFLQTPFYRERIASAGQGIGINNLQKGSLEALPVPIPPLPEQRRIVAKVEELLALCDELEARQVAARERRTRLVHSALDHLTAAKDEQDFRKQCSFPLHNSSLILDSVPALRQAIRSLAVQGHLVPQSPKDEPASGLLKQIGITREHLVKEKKLGASPRMKIKELPSTRLPTGWTWAPFGEVTFCRDGERIPVNSDDRETLAKTYDYYGASGVIDKIDRYLFDTPLLLIGEDGANLVNRSTPIAFIAEGKYWVNNHAHVLDAINRTLLEYLRIYINSIDLGPYITGMAQPKMNQAQMNSIPIALPPLAEQQRIVSKVDELMCWCDALEARLTTAQTTATHLLDATLHQLLQNHGHE